MHAVGNVGLDCTKADLGEVGEGFVEHSSRLVDPPLSAPVRDGVRGNSTAGDLRDHWVTC
jgi:hypothetical protein